MISYASKGSRRGVDVPTVEFVQIEFVLVPCPSRVHSDNEALLILVLVVVDEEQHLGRLCRSSELEFHVPGRLIEGKPTSAHHSIPMQRLTAIHQKAPHNECVGRKGECYLGRNWNTSVVPGSCIPDVNTSSSFLGACVARNEDRMRGAT